MKSLGFAIKKNELWYTVIEGTTADTAEVVVQKKHNFQAASTEAELMQCFYNLFNEIITEQSPDTIACKVSLTATLPQLPYMHYSLGVLAYLCNQKSLPLAIRSTNWIMGGKRKKELLCKAKFPAHTTTNEKLHSVVVALFQLGEVR